MSNFSKTFAAYLRGYIGSNALAMFETQRELTSAALGVHHRVTSKPPLMSSVAVTAELRAMAGKPQAPSKPLRGRCILHRVGENKIAAIKAAREHTSLGLKEAKDLIDACTGESIYQNGVRVGYAGGVSSIIVDNDLNKAELTAKLLRDVGCTVEVA